VSVGERPIGRVRTRDGRLVAFDPARIASAVGRDGREEGLCEEAVAAEATSRLVAASRPAGGGPRRAWRRSKGNTVYRYGPRPDQVLTFLADPDAPHPLLAEAQYAGGCAAGLCQF
jgi:hypothetical protein